MARVLLIGNPVAARHDPAVAETVVRIFRAAGWVVDFRTTAGPVDARRFAAEAVADGVDVVAVFGGDGTTMQAAAAMVGTETVLGLVPGGTGNLLAGNLRVPTGPVQAAELIIRGQPRRIDLGRIERADGIHYFGVACGAGADARVMGNTQIADKRRLGIGGYFGAFFRELPLIRTSRFRVTVDDRPIDREASVCMVLNCGEIIPPFVRAVREAAPDDGVFDVLVLAADSPWQVLRGMTRALANVVLQTGPTPYLIHARGTVVTIETERPEPVQYDGDLAGLTPLTAVMQPGAIRVVAPIR